MGKVSTFGLLILGLLIVFIQKNRNELGQDYPYYCEQWRVDRESGKIHQRSAKDLERWRLGEA